MCLAKGVRFIVFLMIPCTIHIEIHVIIKILIIILQDGLINSQGLVLEYINSLNSERKEKNYTVIGSIV